MEVEEKDRIIRQKEINMMTTLEEVDRKNKQMQEDYNKKIEALTQKIEDQSLWIGKGLPTINLANLSNTASRSSHLTEDSPPLKIKQENTNIFDLSQSISESNMSWLSKLDELDLKNTWGILDDYLYESPLMSGADVSQIVLPIGSGKIEFY